jgi:hypothetical protein
MQKEISPKIIALTFGVLVISFLVGFYVVAWTEPSQAPPGGNVPAPINVSSSTQYKAGALGIGGILQVYSNIVDSASNILYNDSTKKIERARLPFEQGDITSDVDTNNLDVGYYNVANLTPGNIAEGVAFGRNQTGTLAGSVSTDIAAQGLAQVTQDYPIACYPTCPTGINNYAIVYPGALTFAEYDPRGILNASLATNSVPCYSTYQAPCSLSTYYVYAAPTVQCASGWLMNTTNLFNTYADYFCGSLGPFPKQCFSATCRKP